jgi:luciferase family oxidoreductase group 1
LTTPLSVLDLVPISSGSTAAQALRNTIDLARQTEQFGYGRYWFAEHHLNPGVAGASPAVPIALVADATDRIRLGSAGVQLSHRTALPVVEEFGLIDALHPGRLDLGLGRAGPQLIKDRAEQAGPTLRADNGLVIPDRPDLSRLAGSTRLNLTSALLQQPGAQTPDYAQQIDDILALLAGEYRNDGVPASAMPGEQADLQVWILGNSAGQSAQVAGHHGLRFAASYHVAPATVLDAVNAYRQAFVPSADVPRPYVAVSADVVLAEDDDTARELARGYAPWVRSIRRAEGAIPYPTHAEAARLDWTEQDRALVADRVQTQLVGSPSTVAEQLDRLREATGADELVITTITHEHADRVRSYELLAKEWGLS